MGGIDSCEGAFFCSAGWYPILPPRFHSIWPQPRFFAGLMKGGLFSSEFLFNGVKELGLVEGGILAGACSALWAG